MPALAPPLTQHGALQALLTQLQAELQQAGLWQAQLPEAWRLQSTQPFACDTLDFSQWLQFICIARLQALLNNQQPLPTNSAILPAAQQWLGQNTAKTVFERIGELDQLLSSAPQ